MMSNPTLEERFDEIERAMPPETGENESTDEFQYLVTLRVASTRKIQRVPRNIQDSAQFDRYNYSPRMISIGPIYHHLQRGDQLKLFWTKMYLQDRQLEVSEVYRRIASSSWRHLFGNDVIGNYNDNDLAWMLFIDGCSVLYILMNAEIDPEKLKLKDDQLLLVIMDLFLLENQIPLLVLRFLWGSPDEQGELRATLIRFFRSKRYQFELTEKSTLWDDWRQFNVHHMLDLLHKILLLPDREGSNDDISIPIQNRLEECLRYGSIHELKAVGIRVTENTKAQNLTDIKFVPNGTFKAELQIPRLNVTGDMARIFLNLIAYERCLGIQNNYGIISYLNFLNSLIHNIEDVKDLREAGVLRNAFGSDQELLFVFRAICADLGPLFPLATPKCKFIRSDMERFCKEREQSLLTAKAIVENAWRTWTVDLCGTYFRSPWTIIAFLGALLGLSLNAVQTWVWCS